MSLPEEKLHKLVQTTTGPAPWYWETFPEVHGAGSRIYRWRFHGQQEGLNFLVTLHADGEPEKPRLALNTSCRPFPIDSTKIGIWCSEGRALRFVCFEPDRMQPFPFEEIAGWFAPSSERMYAATPPAGEFSVDTEISAGTHSLMVPECFRVVDELLVPASYKALESTDPAAAIFVVYPQAGLLDVLPQEWLTSATYDTSRHWITRATRDPETHRILGELSRAGVFELQENGRELARWL